MCWHYCGCVQIGSVAPCSYGHVLVRTGKGSSGARHLPHIIFEISSRYSASQQRRQCWLTHVMKKNSGEVIKVDCLRVENGPSKSHDQNGPRSKSFTALKCFVVSCLFSHLPLKSSNSHYCAKLSSLTTLALPGGFHICPLLCSLRRSCSCQRHQPVLKTQCHPDEEQQLRLFVLREALEVEEQGRIGAQIHPMQLHRPVHKMLKHPPTHREVASLQIFQQPKSLPRLISMRL